jgi:hypothetical protein
MRYWGALAFVRLGCNKGCDSKACKRPAGYTPESVAPPTWDVPATFAIEVAKIPVKIISKILSVFATLATQGWTCGTGLVSGAWNGVAPPGTMQSCQRAAISGALIGVFAIPYAGQVAMVVLASYQTYHCYASLVSPEDATDPLFGEKYIEACTSLGATLAAPAVGKGLRFGVVKIARGTRGWMAGRGAPGEPAPTPGEAAPAPAPGEAAPAPAPGEAAPAPGETGPAPGQTAPAPGETTPGDANPRFGGRLGQYEPSGPSEAALPERPSWGDGPDPKGVPFLQRLVANFHALLGKLGYADRIKGTNWRQAWALVDRQTGEIVDRGTVGPVLTNLELRFYSAGSRRHLEAMFGRQAFTPDARIVVIRSLMQLARQLNATLRLIEREGGNYSR